MRTPLTAAKLSLHFINKYSKNNALIIEYSQKILSNINRIDEMVLDLLNATKIRAGQFIKLDMISCDLDLILRKTLDELTYIYGERFTILSTEAFLGLWSPSGIKRIVENLCTNALKYGDHNSNVTVTLMSNDKEVILSVHNEGSFISSEEQLYLFDYLTRAPSAVNSDKHGWGIGLTLV